MRKLILFTLISLFVFPSLVLSNAIDFDGTDDSLSCGSGSSIDDIFAGGGCLCSWLDIDQFSASPLRRIGQKRGTIGWEFYYFLAGAQKRFEFGHTFTGTDGTWLWNDILTDTNNHHLCLCYDNSSLLNDPVIYIDGSPTTGTETSTPTLLADTDAGETLYLFNRADAARPHDGLSLLPHIYGTVLTATQVSQISSSRNANTVYQVNTANLVGLWDFNDQLIGTSGDGDSFLDRSGNGNTCTGSDGANNTGLTVVGRPWLTEK